MRAHSETGKVTNERPLAKTFATATQHYVYDASTNALFRSAPAEAAAVELLASNGSSPQVLAKLAERFGSGGAKRALLRIRSCRRKGYLSGARPESFRLRLSREEILEAAASGIKQLILGVTQQCNLRCRYCVYSGDYRSFRVHRPVTMDTEIARKALDFFYDHSGGEESTFVSFYGGEPLLNLELIRWCISYYARKAADRTVGYNLTTNATLLRAPARRFLAEHDVMLRVSLDGPEEIQNANRVDLGGRGSFERVFANLAALKSEYPEYYKRRVSINAVAAAPYRLGPVREFFEREGLFEGMLIAVTGVSPVDTAYVQRYPVAYDGAEIANLRRSYLGEAAAGREPSTYLKALFESRLADIATRERSEIRPVQHPNQVCVPGVRRLFVDASGRFAPCERINETISIGDVDRGFDQERLFGLIDGYVAISEDDCRDCWAQRLCRSCFVSANGNAMDAQYKRQNCTIEKRTIEEALMLYCELQERNAGALARFEDRVFA